jgi:hypothetical protein
MGGGGDGGEITNGRVIRGGITIRDNRWRNSTESYNMEEVY